MSGYQQSENSGPRLDNKVDGLVTHCLYLIATGKWTTGMRLPSIRQAETMWNLNRLTVQKAYRRLEEMGLVHSRVKSGYFVCENEHLEEISRHRYALDNFFRDVAGRIWGDLELSALGVFRYMAQVAEMEFADRPEHAFAECTQLQAEGHAREILQRLQLPVMSFASGDIQGKRSRIPGHIRTLFTTYFHYHELQDIESAGDIDVVAVPIEVSPSIRQQLSKFKGRASFVEIEDVQATRISEDSMSFLDNLNLETHVVSDVEQALESQVAEDPDGIILLSPRLWGTVSESWRTHPAVNLVEFRICPSAWPMIAQRAGLPLGAF